MKLPYITEVVSERFDWLSEDETCSISFDVMAITKAILANKLRCECAESPMDYAFAEQWISKRDINLDYVKAMSKPQRDTPVLGAKLKSDDSVILINGSHRYMARCFAGEKTIRWILIEEDDWKPYAIIKGKL